MSIDFNKKLDSIYNELNEKFEALNTYVKKLDIQVAQTVEAMQRHERLLPESSNTSQKHFVSAILVDGDKHHVSGKLNELNEAEYRVREDSVDRHNLGVRYTHWAETDKNRPRIAILTLKTRH